MEKVVRGNCMEKEVQRKRYEKSGTGNGMGTAERGKRYAENNNAVL